MFYLADPPFLFHFLPMYSHVNVCRTSLPVFPVVIMYDNVYIPCHSQTLIFALAVYYLL